MACGFSRIWGIGISWTREKFIRFRKWYGTCSGYCYGLMDSQARTCCSPLTTLCRFQIFSVACRYMHSVDRCGYFLSEWKSVITANFKTKEPCIRWGSDPQKITFQGDIMSRPLYPTAYAWLHCALFACRRTRRTNAFADARVTRRRCDLLPNYYEVWTLVNFLNFHLISLGLLMTI